jgi:hypothetical protein
MINKAISAALDEVRVALPGVVEKYNLDEQTVDVRPLLLHRLIDDDGAITREELPVIPSVPVTWQRAGGFFQTLPLARGDTGIIIFCDWSIDQWLEKGGSAPVDPLDARPHSLTAATFSPGLHDLKNPIADAHAENMVLGKDGGSQVHIKPNGEIHLGSESAADFVGLAGKILTELQAAKADRVAMKTTFDSHAHIMSVPSVTPGPAPQTAAPPAVPMPTPTDPNSVAADKVKAD